MPNYSKHIIVGHVGTPPTLKYTDTGIAVASFTLAVNNPRRKDDPPTWFRISAWRSTAEFVNSYVTKGAAVLVEGEHLKLSEWTAQDGSTRVSLEMDAQRVELMGGKRDGQEQPADSEQLPF
jgi:single-strand DNA-binding protein